MEYTNAANLGFREKGKFAMTIKELDITYRDTGIPFYKDTLSCPDDVVEYMDGAFAHRQDQEQFWVVLLDNKNRPLGRFLCTMGTISSVTVHPREVFKTALMRSASSIVVVHNHPSGDPTPSQNDRKVTTVLKRASSVIGIELIDHIIVGDESVDPDGIGCYSFFHR